jgi:hypothetical protein
MKKPTPFGRLAASAGSTDALSTSYPLLDDEGHERIERATIEVDLTPGLVSAPWSGWGASSRRHRAPRRCLSPDRLREQETLATKNELSCRI